MSLDHERRRLEVGSLFELTFRFDRTTTVVVAMLGLDVIWWWLLYGGHVPMPGTSWLLKHSKIPMAAPGAMELPTFHVGTLDASVGYTVA